MVPKLQKETVAQQAERLARKAHAEVNHLYDGVPYADAHLKAVADVAEEFIHLIPEKDRDLVRAGCWTHDIIEDARLTYNDVKVQCGTDVAEIAYALTNEKGRTRKERANAKYYQGIRDTQYAQFVKCCDRIANILNSVNNGGNMLGMYAKEHEHFKRELYSEDLTSMFLRMEELFAPTK